MHLLLAARGRWSTVLHWDVLLVIGKSVDFNVYALCKLDTTDLLLQQALCMHV